MTRDEIIKALERLTEIENQLEAEIAEVTRLMTRPTKPVQKDTDPCAASPSSFDVRH